MEQYMAYSDGSARNGVSQIGFSIRDLNGNVIIQKASRLPVFTVYTTAIEYIAIYQMVKEAVGRKLEKVMFYTDNLSVIADLRTTKKVKRNRDTSWIKNQILALFESAGWDVHRHLDYIPGSLNTDAHELSRAETNEVLDEPFLTENLIKINASPKKKRCKGGITTVATGSYQTLSYRNQRFRVSNSVIEGFMKMSVGKEEQAVNLLLHHLLMSKKREENGEVQYLFGTLVFTVSHGVVAKIELVKRKELKKSLSKAEQKKSREIKVALGLKNAG